MAPSYGRDLTTIVAYDGNGRVRTLSTKLHQPRVAEMVADALRSQILNGELPDGGELPSQDRLSEEFGVSRQVIREGLRILEFEKLITVRRGNVGGALVHAPTPSGAAYGLGLVLQSRKVRISQLADALNLLEPLCARLCAERPDRRKTVVPQLRAIQAESVRLLEDIGPYVEAMSRFHRTIITSCGNETVAVIAGAVEEVWLAQVREWGLRQSAVGQFPDLDYRRHGTDIHQELIDLIAAGDGKATAELAENHFDPAQFYTDSRIPHQIVQVSVLRNALGSRRPDAML